MPAPKMLRVYPNPYVFVDGDGRLAGTCPTHAIPGGHTPGQRRFVGAALQATVLEQGDPEKLVPHVQDTTVDFHVEPVEVPDTPDFYYRQRIMHGELVVADEATAKALGRDFEDPARVLAHARIAAIVRFKAEHDNEDPAFASEPCPVLGDAVTKVIDGMKQAADAAAEKAKKEAAKPAPEKTTADKAPTPVGGE